MEKKLAVHVAMVNDSMSEYDDTCVFCNRANAISFINNAFVDVVERLFDDNGKLIDPDSKIINDSSEARYIYDGKEKREFTFKVDTCWLED